MTPIETIVVLGVISILTNATVTSVHSIQIMKEVKRNAEY